MHSPFADYKPLKLPDLSTQRHPPTTRGRTSVPVHVSCTEEILLVAVARCLGAYCSSNDVLLGWQPRSSDLSKITATRICWVESNTWTDVLDSVTQREIEDSPEAINRELEQDSDFGRESFLALLTPSTDYDHPLVLSLDSPSNEDQQKSHTVHILFAHHLLHESAVGVFANQLGEIIKAMLSETDANPYSLSFLSPSLISSVAIRHDHPTYKHLPNCRTAVDYIHDHDPNLDALEFYGDLNASDQEHFVERLTYGELQAQSNRFAAYLCDQGLQSGDRVAICMQRGVEFHISMLGIFKAGGCYVPVSKGLI